MEIKKKILIVVPHLSTGGMPQYLLKQIETFSKLYEIVIVEVNNYSGNEYVVHKNKLKNMCKLHTLSDDKSELLNILEDESPYVIHFVEIPEHFLDLEILDKIFVKENRNYFIVCSTHGSLTNPDSIQYHPDRYILASEWSLKQFEHLGIESIVWEYPIENLHRDSDQAKYLLNLDPEYKHVLNVGLFTSGKNQGEIFKIAEMLESYKIKFHFVGNQAINFKEYWEPLLNNKPDNCVIWKERSDVDVFYQACDLFYFSSKLELNPISIKEALSYKMPCIFRKLHTYLDSYDNIPLVTYINDDLESTKKIILDILEL